MQFWCAGLKQLEWSPFSFFLSALFVCIIHPHPLTVVDLLKSTAASCWVLSLNYFSLPGKLQSLCVICDWCECKRRGRSFGMHTQKWEIIFCKESEYYFFISPPPQWIQFLAMQILVSGPWHPANRGSTSLIIKPISPIGSAVAGCTDKKVIMEKLGEPFPLRTGGGQNLCQWYKKET